MKFFPFTLVFLLFTCFSFGQKAVLYGTITDGETSEALFTASVRVGAVGVVADLDGRYRLELDPGTYAVEFTYIGYTKYKPTVTLTAGQELELNVTLSEAATLLSTATVTSGKYEKPLGEVTVSLEVLKPGLIERSNTVTVDQVLEKVPGVNIIGGQANIRGGSGFSYGAGSRVLLLIDDIPILQADAGFPQWDDVPIESIGQIEVLKGAASALYGSSALNGIINVRTAYAKSEPEGKVALFHTNYFSPSDPDKKWWGDRKPYESGLSFSYKQKIKKLDLVIGAFAINRRSFNQATGASYQRLNLNTRYRFTDKFSVGLNGNINVGSSSSFFYWANAESGAHQGNAMSLSNSRRFRYNLDPFATYFDNAGNRHKLMGRFYNVENQSLSSESDQSNSSDFYYSEYQFQRNMTGVELVFTAGLVASGTNVIAPLYGDVNFLSRNYAAYAQLDKKFFNRLNLSAGFRYEQNRIINPGYAILGGNMGQDTLAAVNPSDENEAKPVFRLGASFQVTEYTFLRASWGQGYRYPTVAERYIYTDIGAVNIIPNELLQSETGWSAELGIKQGFRIGEFNGFLDIAAFWTEYQDMMEFNFTGFEGFQSQNVGGTIIKGGEFTIAGEGKLFGLPTSVLGGYTYIDPKFKQFDNTLPGFGETPTEGQINAANSSEDFNVLKYRNRHTYKFDIETRVKSFSIGLAMLGASTMEAVDLIFEGLVVPGLGKYRDEHNKGYRVFNARIGYNFNEKRRLSLLLNNLTNEEYAVRPGLLEAPRNLSVRLDFGF
ncbi:MAG: TonB-dependent receptor [Saprospiraceae bacterium]|nr:TonB-dependent receptor [Saprospiraceae bacterium]